MKLRFLYLLFSFLTLSVSAQLGNNTWINYSQSYFKFPVANTGMHKIGYQALADAGINMASLNPDNLQIFGRGEEQYLHIEGGDDGTFDPLDYILLYAEKNDGYFDAQMYKDPGTNSNPYYSLINDTSYFFVTTNTSINNRRIEQDNDVNFGAYTAAPYFNCEQVISLSNQYGAGLTSIIDTHLPFYMPGEGWMGPTIFMGGIQSHTIATPSYYVPGGSGTVEATIMGLTNSFIYKDHHLEVSFNGKLKTDTFYEGHNFLKLNYTFPAAEWASSSVLKFESNSSDTTNTADRSAVGYVKMKYPRTFDLGNATSQYLEVLNGTGKAFLSMSNFNNQNSTAWLFDISNHKRTIVSKVGAVFKTLVPNSLAPTKKCLLTTEANFINVAQLEPAIYGVSSFTDYKTLSQSNGGYDYFILTVKEFKAEAELYKNYRNSAGYKAVVIDMEELYMQYADGIRKHPMSIRNFARDIIKNWGTTPQYFFLIGKSIQPGTPDSKTESNTVLNSSRRNAINYANNKIPTFGHPGSDVFLTAQISDSSLFDPDIAIGRLSAVKASSITDYLNKVQEFENNQQDYWMKRVLHFGGGTEESQGATFAAYLNGYKNIIQDTCFGGTVNTYLKNTTNPLQLNVSDSIRTNINDGCSLMTFFGHAYGEGFDQNIDAPDSYTNQGKYPLIIANSCLIGNIHLPSFSSGSETWVLPPNRGSIGFLASVSLGIPSPLNEYSKAFYTNLGQKNYGKGLGKIQQAAIRSVQKPQGILLTDDDLVQDVCMMMTLHCDPAIVLNAHAKPDYTLYGTKGKTQPMVTVNPVEVTSELNTFTITMDIANLGRAVTDSIQIRIIRSFSTNAPDTAYLKRILSPKFKSTVQFTLPVELINGVGLNHFKISVDSENAIDELDEDNNIYEFDLTIRSSGIVPVYPYKYAIVPKKSIVLKANTVDPFAGERKYIFQIDTNKNFSSASPMFYEAAITKSGGVVVWDPANDPGLANIFNSLPSNTTLATPTVFFWRVSPDSSYAHKFTWNYSSFQYVQNKVGWGQAHFQQIDEDEFNFIDLNETTRSFSFLQHIKEIKASACSWLNDCNQLRIDGALKAYYTLSVTNLIMISVIDQYSLEPWDVNSISYHNQINYNNAYSIPTFGDKIFWFKANDGTDNSVIGMNSVLSAAKDGDYIVMYNQRYPYFKENFNNHGANGAAFKTALHDLGANTDSLNNYIGAVGSCPFPYILIAQKGNPSYTKEAFSNNCGGVTLTSSMSNNWINGNITSPLIGPALKWTSLHWQSTSTEPLNLKDTLSISVFGVNLNNNETLLTKILAPSADVLQLDTLVDAKTYPFVRLEAYLADDSMHTPVQLKRWQVVYDEVMEVAVNPNATFSITSDSLQQGNNFKMTVALVNISETDADSLQVTYWFTDASNNISTKQYRLLPPLKAGATYIDTVQLSTMNIMGDNRLWYEVNPYTGPRPWQLEQHHFNNSLEAQFSVFRDRTNPLLDVVFDGVHIINGDIVSPTTLITIQLKDENKFLALDDPALFKIYIRDPNGVITMLTPKDFTFYPASLPENKSRIEIKGNYTLDGKYELMVRASDRSNNKSGLGDGAYDYRIEFEIILKSSITNVINWPNPFTTSTQFVFTLTGSEIPTDFRIKIMNITGKVVKEIGLDELGPINIGKNITQYKWNGTDEFGDILANGVYLYEVIAKINGQDIDTREVQLHTNQGESTLQSKFFAKGLGKMYIMR